MRLSVFLSSCFGLLLCQTLAFSANGPAATYIERPLKIDVVVNFDGNHAQLLFDIENISGKPVAIRKRDLPWEDPSNVITVLIAKRTGVPICRSPTIEDYFSTPDIVELPARGRIRGGRALTMFDDAMANRAINEPIIVGWFYEPKAANARHLGQYGGWLEVVKPRR